MNIGAVQQGEYCKTKSQPTPRGEKPPGRRASGRRCGRRVANTCEGIPQLVGAPRQMA